MSSFIDLAQQGNVSSAKENELISLSGLCADEKGDVVHWARGMAATYDDNYYEGNDGCRDLSGFRSQEPDNRFDHASLSLFPNPTNEAFTLEIENGKYTSELQILDLTGKLLYSQSLSAKQSWTKKFDFVAGTYLVRLEPQFGEIINKKVVVTN